MRTAPAPLPPDTTVPHPRHRHPPLDHAILAAAVEADPLADLLVQATRTAPQDHRQVRRTLRARLCVLRGVDRHSRKFSGTPRPRRRRLTFSTPTARVREVDHPRQLLDLRQHLGEPYSAIRLLTIETNPQAFSQATDAFALSSCLQQTLPSP